MIPSQIWYVIVFNQVTERKKIDRISGEWSDRLLAGSRTILSSRFPFCDEEDEIQLLAGLRLEITTRYLDDNCVSVACSIYHFAHLLRAVSKNSGYVYTDYFMESACVRHLHTSENARTSECSETSQFSDTKYRTKHFPCCNLFTLYLLRFISV